MKLATRLTILLIVITTVVALSVGWYAVNSSTHSAYDNLNQTVNAVVQSGLGTPDEALSDAIPANQTSNAVCSKATLVMPEHPSRYQQITL